MSSATVDYWKRPRLIEALLLGEDHLADLLHAYFSTEYGDEDAKNMSRSPMHDRWMEWSPLNGYHDYLPDHSLVRNDSHSVRRACKRNRLDFDFICGVIRWYTCNAGHRNQYGELVKKRRYDLLEVKFLFEQEVVRDFFAAERDYGANSKRREQAKDIRRWFEAAGRTHYAWMFCAARYAEVFSAMPTDPGCRKAVKFVEYLKEGRKFSSPARASLQNHLRQPAEMCGGEPTRVIEPQGIASECNACPTNYSEPPPPYPGPMSPKGSSKLFERWFKGR